MRLLGDRMFTYQEGNLPMYCEEKLDTESQKTINFGKK